MLSEVALVRATRNRVRALAALSTPAARIGACALGAGLGALFTAVVPRQILTMIPFTGASIILSPMVAAAVMHRFGRWRTVRGHLTTVLTTPVGAAAFALGFAAVRALWLYVVSGGPAA